MACDHMTRTAAAALLLLASSSALLAPTPSRLAPRVAAVVPLRAPPLRLAAGANARKPSPLSRLVQRLRPKQADGSVAPLPMWTRRSVAVLKRLRPILPLLLVLGFLFAQATRRSAAAPRLVELSYFAFMKLIDTKPSSVTNLRISLSRISFMLDGKSVFTRPVRAQDSLIWFLHKSGVDFRAAATSAASALLPLLFPCLWLGAVYTMMRRQMGGATGSVGKKASSSLRLSSDDLDFDDVAGIDSAKEEVREIVSMLKEPGRYAKAGARLPAGVLMVGPPGTGKTLLARVMAAQADVPFFYCSGSDFVELFVGRGAARMRSLFKEAAAAAPCLVFVDELDALGKQRSLRISGSNDEVEQTLNQMLACMDGVDSSNNGVVVMGATNRYEILDPALTRPGRFDRLVRINLPDASGRLDILRVHTRRLSLGPSVDLKAVAEVTAQYSGAELAALANEAAIRAVRRSSEELNQQDFLTAADAFSTARRRMPSVESLARDASKWFGGGEQPPNGSPLS